MNACSYASRTASWSARLGSAPASPGAPARLSSQLAPHRTGMSLPVRAEIACADGFGVSACASIGVASFFTRPPAFQLQAALAAQGQPPCHCSWSS